MVPENVQTVAWAKHKIAINFFVKTSRGEGVCTLYVIPLDRNVIVDFF